MTDASQVTLFNSMTRKLEPFEPLREDGVRIYTCGPTVYNYAHLGNLRAYVFGDTLRRVLQWKGFDVVHVINITDVGHLTSDADEGEDKVEVAARRANRSAYEITNYYTDAYFADLKLLGIRPAAMYPRATEHIQEMIAFVQDLADKGLTYEIEDGLYFDTSKVADYGALGALNLEAQQHGSRVAAHQDKRQPWDFCLWRRSPPDQRRLMEWESPWGRGFPGWHLECSVMSHKYLDFPFDIHTGGVDHRQVHHCNEIAQNQGYQNDDGSGVNYWLHCEFLVMREEKMSKSKGNFWRLQTLLDKGVHPLVYRFFLLQATYRTQLEFSKEGLVAARTGFDRIVRRLRGLLERTGDEGRQLADLSAEAESTTGGSFGYLRELYEQELDGGAAEALERFDQAVSEDLGTPRGIAVLTSVVADPEISDLDKLRLVGTFDLVLGLRLLTIEPEELNIRPDDAELTNEQIEALIAERKEARQSKDWSRADELRDELAAAKVLVKDDRDAGETVWMWKPDLD
ncbi:MAG: cysteine--tRNA ligase [Acidobacteriota bacterium]